MLGRHRERRTLGSPNYILDAYSLVVLTVPITYSLVVSLLLLDLSVGVSQARSVTAYEIEKCGSRMKVVFDRHNRVSSAVRK